jgi:hypothetical protein
MKIKIWTVNYDDFNGIGSSPHGTEAAARAEFDLMVRAMWERLHPDEPQPDDAYKVMTEDLDADFAYSIDEQEIEVPFPSYSFEIEAALCVWEWMNLEANVAKFDNLWGDYGTGGMRMSAVQAGLIVNTVYALMEARGLEFTYAYDFDFVPAVLEQLDWPALVDNNQYGKGTLRPDPAPLLDKILADHPDKFHDLWLDTAKREAIKQWGYEDLVRDFEDRIDRTEKPAEWVERIGNKYDLTPAN